MAERPEPEIRRKSDSDNAQRSADEDAGASSARRVNLRSATLKPPPKKQSPTTTPAARAAAATPRSAPAKSTPGSAGGRTKAVAFVKTVVEPTVRSDLSSSVLQFFIRPQFFEEVEAVEPAEEVPPKDALIP